VESSPIPYLGYSEAVELARLDTPVLHPATVEPLRGIGIPLEIRDLRSVVKDQAASIIGPDLIQTHKVKAIGCLPNVTRLTVSSSSLEAQSELLGRVLIGLADENIACWNLDSIPGQISWIVSQHDLEKANRIITNHFNAPEVSEYGVMFSLVGNKLPNVKNALLSTEMTSLLELEIVSITDHAVRVISTRNDISVMLETLANELELTIKV